MESLKRDTRLKLSHNPTGELVKILTQVLSHKAKGWERKFPFHTRKNF
jgi:hypothetical protein